MSHLGATLCYKICISDLRSAAAVGTVCYSRSEGRFPFGVSLGLAKAVCWPLVSGRGVLWAGTLTCGLLLEILRGFTATGLCPVSLGRASGGTYSPGYLHLEVGKITQPKYLFRQLLMNVIKIYPNQI